MMTKIVSLVICSILWLQAGRYYMEGTSKYSINKTKYPYGIEIVYFDNGGSDTDTAKEGISIYQYGKKVDTVNAIYLYDSLFKGDLDGDGYLDIVYKTLSNDDTFDLYIISIKPKVQISVFKDVSADISISKNIQNQKIIHLTECFGFVMAAKHACVEISSLFDGKRLKLAMPTQTLKIKPSFQRVSVFLDKYGFIDAKQTDCVINIIAEMLQYFYTGHPKTAFDVMRKKIDFHHSKALRFIFLQELTEQLIQNRFYDDMAYKNHWLDNDNFSDDINQTQKVPIKSTLDLARRLYRDSLEEFNQSLHTISKSNRRKS